jgi:hypothetical protein
MTHYVLFANQVEPPITDAEARFIFGPLDDGDEIIFSDAMSMEELGVEQGIFKSRGQARKAGFKGPVPWGVGWYGTKRPTNRFWAWNPIPTVDRLDRAFDKTTKYCFYADDPQCGRK